MPDNKMRMKDVIDEFGFSRSTLLRYEEQGKLNPGRTPGGQRRYNRSDIEGMLAGQNDGGSKVGEMVAAANLYQEMGSTGASKWSTNIFEDKLREFRGRAGLTLLREMRINDPVISAVFFAIENAMKQGSWRVSPASDKDADKQVAEFVESCMHDMSFSWTNTLSFILQELEQGYSTLEVVFKRRLGERPPEYTDDPASSHHDDGRIGWRKWATRPGETLVDGDEFIIDDHGGIHGINQEIPGSGIMKIPIEKLLLFRTTVVPANTPYGLPIHRSMYLPYWYTQNLMEIEGIGVERDLAGIPVVYLGNDTTKAGPNSDYEKALDLVTNIRNDEQAGIVIPKPKMSTSTDGNGILFELVSSSGRRQHNTGEIIERYDKRKALAVLAQFIMLGMERVGSFALSKSQGDLFVLSVEAWLQDIADIINSYAIPRLIRYNAFSGISGYPTLVPGVVGVPDLESIGNYVNTLVNADIIKVDDELERHLRHVGRLPAKRELSEEEIAAGGLGQDLTLEKAALITRRTGLAVNSLLDIGVIAQDRAIQFMTPLIDELEQAIFNETSGGTTRRPKISAATEIEQKEETEETALELLNRTKQRDKEKPPPDDDEEDEED